MAAAAQRETAGKSGRTHRRDPRTVRTAQRHRPARLFKVHEYIFQGKYDDMAATRTICVYIFFLLFSFIVRVHVTVARVGHEEGTDKNSVPAQEQRRRLHGFHRDFQTDPEIHERRVVVAQTRTGARRLHHSQSKPSCSVSTVYY